MENLTREKFTATLEKIAKVNGVADPSKIQCNSLNSSKMIDAIQLSSEFLKRINIQPVKELEGEAIGLNQGSTIAGRTNTKGGTPRKPVDPTGLESNTYKCAKLILM